jgi:hypothetical protein
MGSTSDAIGSRGVLHNGVGIYSVSHDGISKSDDDHDGIGSGSYDCCGITVTVTVYGLKYTRTISGSHHNKMQIALQVYKNSRKCHEISNLITLLKSKILLLQSFMDNETLQLYLVAVQCFETSILD